MNSSTLNSSRIVADLPKKRLMMSRHNVENVLEPQHCVSTLMKKSTAHFTAGRLHDQSI